MQAVEVAGLKWPLIRATKKTKIRFEPCFIMSGTRSYGLLFFISIPSGYSSKYSVVVMTI